MSIGVGWNYRSVDSLIIYYDAGEQMLVYNLFFLSSPLGMVHEVMNG